MKLIRPIGIAVLAAAFVLRGANAQDWPEDGTRQAVAFLTREVPAWAAENQCYSCHNNGDGARALLVARQRGLDVPEAALRNTVDWLIRPEHWEHNGGDGEFNDRRLATLQFGSALAELLSSTDENRPTLPERAAVAAALRTAAAKLAPLQSDDGSWCFVDDGLIGSPVGYGRSLSTVLARDVLRRADSVQFADPIAKADAWLRRTDPRNVLDSAAVLLGLADATDQAAVDSRRQRLETIRAAQHRNGGWGPFVTSQAEPFDTAVVLLALARLPTVGETQQLIAHGRQFLFATQSSSGDWPATTRPPGAESYAQQMSTTAWATLALLMTEAEPR